MIDDFIDKLSIMAHNDKPGFAANSGQHVRERSHPNGWLVHRSKENSLHQRTTAPTGLSFARRQIKWQRAAKELLDQAAAGSIPVPNATAQIRQIPVKQKRQLLIVSDR